MNPRYLIHPNGIHDLLQLIDHGIESVVAIAVYMAEDISVGCHKLSVRSPCIEADGIDAVCNIASKTPETPQCVFIQPGIVPVRSFSYPALSVTQKEWYTAMFKAVHFVHMKAVFFEYSEKIFASRSSKINGKYPSFRHQHLLALQ